MHVCEKKKWRDRIDQVNRSIYVVLQFLIFLLISFVNLNFSLAPLVKKVSETRVVEMTNKLCGKLLNGKDQHRDVASIALKTVVAEVSVPSLAQSILITLSPQLIKGITTAVSVWNIHLIQFLMFKLRRIWNFRAFFWHQFL